MDREQRIDSAAEKTKSAERKVQIPPPSPDTENATNSQIRNEGGCVHQRRSLKREILCGRTVHHSCGWFSSAPKSISGTKLKRSALTPIWQTGRIELEGRFLLSSFAIRQKNGWGKIKVAVSAPGNKRRRDSLSLSLFIQWPRKGGNPVMDACQSQFRVCSLFHILISFFRENRMCTSASIVSPIFRVSIFKFLGWPSCTYYFCIYAISYLSAAGVLPEKKETKTVKIVIWRPRHRTT